MHYHTRFKPLPWYRRAFSFQNIVGAGVVAVFALVLFGIFSGNINMEAHYTKCINGYVFVVDNYNNIPTQMMGEGGNPVRCQ